MVDGILDDGLEGDLVAQKVQAGLLHIEAVRKLVFIAVGLDFEIAFGVAQLRADGDELVAAADADAKELGQGVDHLHRLVVAALLTHPGNGIQGVIEKVRVDLGLERLELGLSQVDLLTAHRVHELLDFHHHMAEGFRELLHLHHAAHRHVGKAPGTLFKLAHGPGQTLERPGQGPGDDDAAKQRRQEDGRRCQGQQAEILPDAGGDQLIDIAHAHHPPGTSLHRVDDVDHIVVIVCAVGQPRQGGGVLLLELGVDELLLGMVEDITLIHQKAVAVLADADVVDIGRDGAKPQIQRHPGLLAAALQGGNHGDHPGIPAFEDRLHMGLGDIARLVLLQLLDLKGEVFIDHRPRLVIQGAAVQQRAAFVVGSHRRHIRANAQQILKKLLPGGVLPAGSLQGGFDQVHYPVHIRDVVRHSVAHLLYSLARRGLGAAHQRALVSAEKERHGKHHHPQHHAGDDQHQNAAHPKPLHTLPLPSPRRSPTGETPKYFLKQ